MTKKQNKVEVCEYKEHSLSTMREKMKKDRLLKAARIGTDTPLKVMCAGFAAE